MQTEMNPGSSANDGWQNHRPIRENVGSSSVGSGPTYRAPVFPVWVRWQMYIDIIVIIY